jgi:alcohol dehydrogenase
MTTFHNPVKLNAGLKALDSLQGELASRGCYRPLCILSPGAEKAGFIKRIKRTCEYPELPVVVVRGGESGDDLRSAYRREGCDGVIAAGGEAAMKAAREVTNGPWAAVPCGEYGGRGLVSKDPDERSTDLAVIDPRLFRAEVAECEVPRAEVKDPTHSKVWMAVAASLVKAAEKENRAAYRRYVRALAAVSAEIAGGIAGSEEGTVGPARIPAYFEFTGRGRIVSGDGALERLPEALTRLGGRRPMLLSDYGVAAAGLTKLVEEALARETPAVVTDSSIPSDSDVTVVQSLGKIYREKGCDALVAVGGGSVLDTAKGVNILVGTGAHRLEEYAGAGKINRPLPPLAAVPTTSGTGSETTLVAVIADHEASRKLLYTSPFLQPDIAVLDPRMTVSLPPALTAATGMDALTHAMEAYFCLGHNPVSDQHALEAVRLIGRHLMHVVEQPDDVEGRAALAEASNLAGLAFSNSMVAMVHTLGHSVGAVCGVHHGVCMSVLLPYGIEYNLGRVSSDMGPLLEALTGKISGEAGPKLTVEVRRMNDELHRLTGGRHPRNLAEALGQDGKPLVRQEQLPEIARVAMGDGSVLYNPEELDYDDALRVLQKAYKGAPLV